MQEYELVREELLSCFLTELSDDTPTSYVEEITRKFLIRKYTCMKDSKRLFFIRK